MLEITVLLSFAATMLSIAIGGNSKSFDIVQMRFLHLTFPLFSISDHCGGQKPCETVARLTCENQLVL